MLLSEQFEELAKLDAFAWKVELRFSSPVGWKGAAEQYRSLMPGEGTDLAPIVGLSEIPYPWGLYFVAALHPTENEGAEWELSLCRKPNSPPPPNFLVSSERFGGLKGARAAVFNALPSENFVWTAETAFGVRGPAKLHLPRRSALPRGLRSRLRSGLQELHFMPVGEGTIKTVNITITEERFYAMTAAGALTATCTPAILEEVTEKFWSELWTLFGKSS